MDRDAMALSIPRADWVYFTFASWWEPRGEEEHIAWARSVFEAMRRWSPDAVAVNFMANDEGAARLRRSFGDEKLERLVALKDAYDPQNVFALNQNIPPSR
ncbi:MAG: BBE domain-containing protein [Chloroflexota bacterium]|nr:BBE domain-containing protein [Chloroflexota bacterium]